jgi:predicted dehydrogenase
MLAAGGALLQETGGRKLKVGIVGGRFGTSFQFHEHPACEVAAVAELREDRRAALSKTYRCGTVYDSLDALLKDRNVEAVGLFTPAPEHVRHAEQALAAGKHVLSAVPAAMSLAECERLIAAVRRSGLTYMMAETSYYQQLTISAREFYREGQFGEIYFCESEYHHPGLEELFFEDGKRTWRHGFPPMHYPTHCTAHLLSVTGERLTEVSCHGWGDGHAILKDNVYRNPFWNETALFRTDKGHSFRVAVWWRGAHLGTERAQWYGDRMSFFMEHPNGLSPRKVHAVKKEGRDDAGFTRWASKLEPYEEVKWWATGRLPAPLRHNSGHQGSHTFLTHEFVEAVLRRRRPAVDVYEAVSYTAPGIVAHQSALKGGALLKIPAFGPAERKR